MSEELEKDSPVVSSLLSNPDEEVSPEKLLELMEIWKKKIEEEITDHETKKAGIYAVYKKQKDMYDKWLSTPLGKMKKLDKIISGRKKVLIDIEKEIKKIKEGKSNAE